MCIKVNRFTANLVTASVRHWRIYCTRSNPNDSQLSNVKAVRKMNRLAINIRKRLTGSRSVRESGLRKRKQSKLETFAYFGYQMVLLRTIHTRICKYSAYVYACHFHCLNDIALKFPKLLQNCVPSFAVGAWKSTSAPDIAMLFPI